MADDVELLRLYAEEKSEAAFRELVDKHLSMVYSAALRRVGGDTHAAQDVSQQVFATLAQRASYLPTDVELSGWLYGTTRNVAVDYVQKERRRKNREAEAYAMQPLISETEDPQDWERLRPVLDREIDKLGARDRQALLLRFFAQCQFAEVGKALGVSADAARMRVDRALERLHRSLVRRGAATSLGAMTALLSEKAVGRSANWAARKRDINGPRFYRHGGKLSARLPAHYDYRKNITRYRRVSPPRHQPRRLPRISFRANHGGGTGRGERSAVCTSAFDR